MASRCMAAKIGLVCWVIVLLCLVLLQSPQMSPAQSLSLPVCELQGAGSSSPYSGEQVQTEGVVHLDLDDTSRRGFFLQHAACDPDPLTSDGIFVYLGEQGDWVASGDRVQVNGRVQEYYGLTEIASSPSDVSVLSHNNPLPIAVKFDPPAERAAGSAYLETLGGGEGMYLFPPGPCIPPGATSLIAVQADLFQSLYGLMPQYEIINTSLLVPDLVKDIAWASGNLSLSNTGDEVLLMGLDEGLLDSLSWGSSDWAFVPDVAAPGQGVSLERYPTDQDHDHAADWRLQTQPAPGGVAATPTPTATLEPVTPSPTPLPTGDGSALVLNELHADPDATLGDANGDGQVDPVEDEFVEIVNSGLGPMDLSGWRLEVGFNLLVHRFPENTWLAPGSAIVVFGGGEPLGEFGDSLVQTASTGGLELLNTGDILTLKRPDGQVLFTFTYGLEAGDNQSITRSPDITGGEPLIKHSQAEGSAGALFSPGTRLDGTLFTSSDE